MPCTSRLTNISGFVFFERTKLICLLRSIRLTLSTAGIIGGVRTRRSLLSELSRLLVLSNLGVGDGEFRPDLELSVVVVDGFVVEYSEHQLLRIVTASDADPHPLARHSTFAGKFDL